MEDEYATYKKIGQHTGIAGALSMGCDASIEKVEGNQERGNPIRKDLRYITFEYFELGDAFSLIKDQGPLRRELLAQYFTQLLDTLEYLHEEKQLAHLDIKLENILLTEKGVRLCDFGFSEPVDKQIGLKKGTDNYMAPEIYHSRRAPFKGVTADIFSLGVLLFIFMFGTPPFAAATETDPFYRGFEKGYPKVFFRTHPKVKRQYLEGTLDVELQVLLTEMFNKDPAKRPQSIKEIKENGFVKRLY